MHWPTETNYLDIHKPKHIYIYICAKRQLMQINYSQHEHHLLRSRSLTSVLERGTASPLDVGYRATHRQHCATDRGSVIHTDLMEIPYPPPPVPHSTPEEASVCEATLWPFPFSTLRRLLCLFGHRRRRYAPDDATLITGRRAGRSLSGLHLLASHPPALSVIVKTKQQTLSGGERAGGRRYPDRGAALCDSK